MQFHIDRSFVFVNISLYCQPTVGTRRGQPKDVYSNSRYIFIFGLLPFAKPSTFNIFSQSDVMGRAIGLIRSVGLVKKNNTVTETMTTTMQPKKSLLNDQD